MDISTEFNLGQKIWRIVLEQEVNCPACGQLARHLLPVQDEITEINIYGNFEGKVLEIQYVLESNGAEFFENIEKIGFWDKVLFSNKKDATKWLKSKKTTGELG
jgi:hypothetical protein